MPDDEVKSLYGGTHISLDYMNSFYGAVSGPLNICVQLKMMSSHMGKLFFFVCIALPCRINVVFEAVVVFGGARSYLILSKILFLCVYF